MVDRGADRPLPSPQRSKHTRTRTHIHTHPKERNGRFSAAHRQPPSRCLTVWLPGSQPLPSPPGSHTSTITALFNRGAHSRWPGLGWVHSPVPSSMCPRTLPSHSHLSVVTSGVLQNLAQNPTPKPTMCHGVSPKWTCHLCVSPQHSVSASLFLRLKSQLCGEFPGAGEHLAGTEPGAQWG